MIPDTYSRGDTKKQWKLYFTVYTFVIIIIIWTCTGDNLDWKRKYLPTLFLTSRHFLPKIPHYHTCIFNKFIPLHFTSRQSLMVSKSVYVLVFCATPGCTKRIVCDIFLQIHKINHMNLYTKYETFKFTTGTWVDKIHRNMRCFFYTMKTIDMQH